MAKRSRPVTPRGAGALAGEPSSGGTGLRLVLFALGLVAVFAGLFFFGYLPRREREAALQAEVKQESTLTVGVVGAEVAASTAEIALPGAFEAITEAPILARSNGYLVRRYVDIGDRVKTGQLLGEVAAPELDQQVHQARADLERVRAALAHAKASLAEAKANEQLALVTADRWKALVADGVVSLQEADQTDANYKALTAKRQAEEASVLAAEKDVSAYEASLGHLVELQGYERVRAPFAGIVTVRNVDIGSLISNGVTLLFRVAHIEILRIFINVPQSDAPGIRAGVAAEVLVREFPGHPFVGKVVRTANAFDPRTRTLLAEVDVPNPEGVLLPGMYGEVKMTIPRVVRPVLVPGDAVIVRASGNWVGVVRPDGRVQYRKVELGRDFGPVVEVGAGLEGGEQVISHPSDAVREGMTVKAIPVREPSTGPEARPDSPRSGGGVGH
jgi:RND family efflux transporter MFP subunit